GGVGGTAPIGHADPLSGTSGIRRGRVGVDPAAPAALDRAPRDADREVLRARRARLARRARAACRRWRRAAVGFALRAAPGAADARAVAGNRVQRPAVAPDPRGDRSRVARDRGAFEDWHDVPAGARRRGVGQTPGTRVRAWVPRRVRARTRTRRRARETDLSRA